MQLLRHALIALVGLLFVVSGTRKCISFPAFYGALAGYDLLPRLWISPAGIALFVSEIAIGSLAIARPFGLAAPLLIGLLAVFAIAMSLRLLRNGSKPTLGCGCFAFKHNASISTGTIIRAVMIAAVLSVAYNPSSALLAGAISIIGSLALLTAVRVRETAKGANRPAGTGCPTCGERGHDRQTSVIRPLSVE